MTSSANIAILPHSEASPFQENEYLGKEVKLDFVERSSILRCMDAIGYIPLVGTIVGIARIIGGMAIKIISAIGCAIACCSQSSFYVEKCGFIFTRAGDEIGRGILEVFPLLTYLIDKDCKKHEKSGFLIDSPIAHGRYIYLPATSTEECFDPIYVYAQSYHDMRGKIALWHESTTAVQHNPNHTMFDRIHHYPEGYFLLSTSEYTGDLKSQCEAEMAQRDQDKKAEMERNKQARIKNVWKPKPQDMIEEWTPWLEARRFQ